VFVSMYSEYDGQITIRKFHTVRRHGRFGGLTGIMNASLFLWVSSDNTGLLILALSTLLPHEVCPRSMSTLAADGYPVRGHSLYHIFCVLWCACWCAVVRDVVYQPRWARTR